MHQQTENPASDQIDIGKAIMIVWTKRWWVIASVVVFTTLFGLQWYFTRPIYRATIILVPGGTEQTSLGASLANSLGSIGGLASLAGFGVGAETTETEAALAVLRSREFTAKFIQEKDLMPLLFESSWDAAARQWKDPSNPPTLARACKVFNTGIRSISQDKRTSLITMNIDWHNREQAAEWANELVSRANIELRNRAIAKSTAAIGFLKNELEATPLVGTQEAINRLIESQIKQRMIANVTQEYAFRVVDRATVPDRIDKVRPKGSVLFPLGFMIGAIFGVGGVLLASWASGFRASLRR